MHATPLQNTGSIGRLGGSGGSGLALDQGSSRDRDPMWMDPGKILGARTWIPAVFDQSGSLVGVSRRIPAK